MCADSRTLQNFSFEVFEAYAGNHVHDDVMQYADISEWQQELLSGDESKPGRDYWREYCRKIDFSQLEGTSASLEKRPVGEF